MQRATWKPRIVRLLLWILISLKIPFFQYYWFHYYENASIFKTWLNLSFLALIRTLSHPFLKFLTRTFWKVTAIYGCGMKFCNLEFLCLPTCEDVLLLLCRIFNFYSMSTASGRYNINISVFSHSFDTNIVCGRTKDSMLIRKKKIESRSFKRSSYVLWKHYENFQCTHTALKLKVRIVDVNPTKSIST